MVRRNENVLIDVHDHGFTTDDKKKKVQCKYCNKVVSGFYRLKCHLGSLRGDVAPCQGVPPNVKELMRTQLLENKRKSLTKEVDLLSYPDIPLKRERTLVKAKRNDNSRNDQFMVSTSDENQVVAERSTQAHDASEQNEVEQDQQNEVKPNLQIVEYVSKVRNSWPLTGCSILIEEWTDENRRILVNFLVNCPEGTIYLRSYDLSTCVGSFKNFKKVLDDIMEDVGIKNVVQIILPTEISQMRPVSADIVKEHNNYMCWSLDASHYIGLMLDRIKMKKPFGEIINKAETLIRFIHGIEAVLKIFRSFSNGKDLVAKRYKISSLQCLFTLENIVSLKNTLKTMFASVEWDSCIWSHSEEADFVVDLLKDKSFWKGSRLLLAATTPLLRLLIPINGIDKLQAGFMYHSLIQAKEEIKNQFGNKASYYMPFWNVIDDIWNQYLHKPLHCSGYYLNPTLFYTKDFYLDAEIVTGLDTCINNMVQDQHVQVLIHQQLDEYTQGKGGFTNGSTMQGIKDVPPIEWWYHYGSKYPELQNFAIRVLSQTCDGAIRYGLKRSFAEELLSANPMAHDPIRQQGLEELTYLEYNMQLKNSKLKAFSDIYVSLEEMREPG